MQICTNLKTILIAGLTMFIFACNDSSKKEKESKEKTADTTVPEASLLPPAGNPPGVEISPGRKCFSNEGLKYKTTVTLNYSSATEVTGSVSSQELENSKAEVAKFTGTVKGNEITIQFRGTPPVIGAASEWTKKAWRLEKAEGKSESAEQLRIMFNAKNYDTNKWEDTEYLFVLVDCK